MIDLSYLSSPLNIIPFTALPLHYYVVVQCGCLSVLHLAAVALNTVIGTPERWESPIQSACVRHSPVLNSRKMAQIVYSEFPLLKQGNTMVVLGAWVYKGGNEVITV